MNATAQLTVFAIVIGIDNYPQKPLVSCVNDVREISKCLRERAEAMKAKLCLTVLTACSPGPVKSIQSDELTDAEEYATYHRILESLQKTIHATKPGDLIYIHFSGHGTHLPPDRKTHLLQNRIGDTALVVLNDLNQGIRYFRGWHLARLIREMISNADEPQSAEVILVLDCCVAGSVMRYGPEHEVADARFLPYDSHVDEEFPPSSSELAPEEDFQNHYATSTRASSLLPGWIRNPQGYCILAACGPNELALNIGGGSLPAHGLFSYCLIRALRGQRVQSFRQVFDNALGLSKQLQAHHQPFPKQNPMWFGNINIQSLGLRTTTKTASTFLVAKQNSQGSISYRLEGGWAHGIRENDIFDITYQFSMIRVTTARAVQVSGLMSTLQLAEGQLVQNSQILFATPVTQNIFKDYSVTLSTTSLSPETILQWRNLRKKHPWLQIDSIDLDTGPKSIFWIAASTSAIGYDLRRGNAAGTTLGVALNASTALSLAQQIAIWEFVRSLRDGPADILPQSCYSVRFRSLDNPQTALSPGSVLLVRHNSIVEIFFENLDTQTLYVHIYRLGQGWEVENLMNAHYVPFYPAEFSRQDQRDYETPYEQKLRRPFKIKMTVPEPGDECEDIFKVFITERPTSFDTLIFTKFGDQPELELKEQQRANEDLLGSCTNVKGRWAVVDVTVKVSKFGT